MYILLGNCKKDLTFNTPVRAKILLIFRNKFKVSKGNILKNVYEIFPWKSSSGLKEEVFC